MKILIKKIWWKNKRYVRKMIESNKKDILKNLEDFREGFENELKKEKNFKWRIQTWNWIKDWKS